MKLVAFCTDVLGVVPDVRVLRALFFHLQTWWLFREAQSYTYHPRPLCLDDIERW
jgi:hypothetical protein